MELQDSIRLIKGIGEKAEKLFWKLGIRTVEELLCYYPREYEVYEDLKPVASLREGQVAAIQVTLETKPKMNRVRNLKILSTRVHDATGSLPVTWFNMPFLAGQLHMGQKYIMRGKIIRKNGALTMNQPKLLSEQEFFNRLHKMQPVYGLTNGLTNHAITKAVGLALQETELPGDYLPLSLRKENNLVERKKAIREIHFPKDKQSMLAARRRIVFEEFFLFTLALHQMKRQKNVKQSAYVMKEGEWCETLLDTLPYRLTGAQKRAWKELKEDLTSGMVMNRLVQGDVGSGKTIVAVLALLLTVENGYQGALMVPTEVLAKQHFESFRELLKPFGIRLALLVGSMTAKEKREAYAAIREQEADIVIGTHALIQEKVEYRKLALVVTDEQHRFGVRQRELLSKKGEEPHMLVMSATPIPRTLAIIVYGDLDISVMDELPAERLPIKNCVVGTSYRPSAYHFMDKQVGEGRQVYVICPMVEESENLEVENVIDYTERLRRSLAPSVRIACLHGKMKPAEKNQIMEAFGAGEIQVLVSTTVIEVGINVPNATVMLIENAERFGLAQLHQLRGRVGRGSQQSYCIFMSGNESREAMERLEILGHSNDGFRIAEEDLKLRGPGDMFGIRQSGDLHFKLADIIGDAEILKAANRAAKEFTGEDIRLLCKKYRGLREKISLYSDEVFL